MSYDSNTPQDNPYGQQSPAYGDQSTSAQGYGGQPGSGYGAAPSYASWGKRVLAYLIDMALFLLAYIPFIIGAIYAGSQASTGEVGSTGSSATPAEQGFFVGMMALTGVLFLAIFIWNICLKQGKTGYTVGKGVMGIKLIKEDTGQPIGAGMAFLRYLLTQAISAVTCGIGGLIDLLWPLWDSKRQTLHDKILSTVVINQPKG